MWVSAGVFGGGVVRTWREAPRRLFGSREVASGYFDDSGSLRYESKREDPEIKRRKEFSARPVVVVRA